MLGILLIDKPGGITSHDVVSRMRKLLDTRRVGHAGTLDPLATGLLVVAVGPATRFLQYLQLEPKGYVCTFRFGVETDTFDSDGNTVGEGEVPENLAARIEAELPSYLGEIEQTPPMFSAVKKDGKPLYIYARKGETVDREPRKVVITEYELLDLEGADAQFRIVCSRGTYVRALAQDLGAKVGCGAHVAAIRRTQVGRFLIEDAVTLDDACGNDLVPLSEALAPMPMVRLTNGQVQLVQNGGYVRRDGLPAEPMAALTDSDGNVVCVARVLENEAHPKCVIPKEAQR
ncbi:MAG: tRNA pseudouridine(55) synthase TruB [Armatimonadetes bacterium]|nr:tRNA pseudouridine(55) synthase TruB [Armatimonadota bacterium]